MAIHINSVTIHQELFPDEHDYPFCIPIFKHTQKLSLNQGITFFIGENGSGKSTLIEALALRCGIHIWRNTERRRFQRSKYEDTFYNYLSVEWTNGSTPGSFFGSKFFHHFAQNLDDWAISDPAQLKYFGGKSLLGMSHGQSLLAYFENRYLIKGVYFLDEPETALSPKSQLKLVEVIRNASEKGKAQFIIATHSPILMACPDSVIYCFDGDSIDEIEYTQTEYFQIYFDFLNKFK